MFVFLFNVTVWYTPHFPSIAERMVSISVPSCRGWEQASISYQKPSWVSPDPYLWQSRSERLLPAGFVRPVPGLSHQAWPLTQLNWKCCQQPHRKSWCGRGLNIKHRTKACPVFRKRKKKVLNSEFKKMQILLVSQPTRIGTCSSSFQFDCPPFLRAVNRHPPTLRVETVRDTMKTWSCVSAAASSR